MEQEWHKAHYRKNYFEEFRDLRESEYWLFLSPQIKAGILSLLDEAQDQETYIVR